MSDDSYAELGGYEVIHLGGEAAVVPMSDLRRLRAVERHASAETLAEAEIEATLAGHREWVTAGRPGAVSHEEAMTELLGGAPVRIGWSPAARASARRYREDQDGMRDIGAASRARPIRTR